MARSLLRSFFLISTAFLALPAAALADAPKIEKLNAYLIYEDSGEMSKNVAAKADTGDTIVANDEKGQSVQMVVDIVMGGKANQLYENAPVLHVVVHGSDPGTEPLVNAEFPINFMAKSKLFRTVVVDHNCNGVDIDAYMMDGKKKVSEIKKSFSITCGD
jgi:hypothetical protein